MIAFALVLEGGFGKDIRLIGDKVVCTSPDPPDVGSHCQGRRGASSLEENSTDCFREPFIKPFLDIQVETCQLLFQVPKHNLFLLLPCSLF